LLVELVVVLEELPDSYVVAPPVYPPSILVLLPETFVWVFAANTIVGKSKLIIITRSFFIVMCRVQNFLYMQIAHIIRVYLFQL